MHIFELNSQNPELNSILRKPLRLDAFLNMKRIIFLILMATFVAGCSVLKPTPRQATTYLVDFRPYSSADFFLSPDPYQGEFEPIGEIRIEVTPALVEPRKSSKFHDAIYGQNHGIVPEVVPMEDLLETVVAQALNLGANGIANLKVSTEVFSVVKSRGLFRTTTMPVTKYVVTGFCIVRK